MSAWLGRLLPAHRLISAHKAAKGENSSVVVTELLNETVWL